MAVDTAGIAVKGLVKRFGKATALHGIDFEVARGELISILGPSGCGKTTTLRCIAGLEEGDEGEIYIAGRLVSDFARRRVLAPDRRGIGMVFQSYAIWPHMTVYQNVAYPLVARGMPRKAIREPVMESLALVGMADFADRPATNLSGGQQQRVALARALVARPQLLLLDEPLSNLDAKLRDQTRFEVRQIQQRLGVTALYVTHDQSEAMAISDRIIVMNGGRIEQIGTPLEVYQRPASPFVADFVGSSNFLELRDTAVRDGFVVGVTAGGQPIRVAGGSHDGGRLLVAVRPQFCTAWPAGAPVPEGQNRLLGRITRTTYFGERSEAIVDAGGESLLVYLPLGSPLATGQDVQVTFAPEHCIPLAGQRPSSTREGTA